MAFLQQLRIFVVLTKNRRAEYVPHVYVVCALEVFLFDISNPAYTHLAGMTQLQNGLVDVS